MAMTIKVLALDQLTNETTGRSLYKASATAPMKSALIKAMRFTNVASSATFVLNVYFIPAGSDWPDTPADPHYSILPAYQPLPAGYGILEEAELTLGSGDAIYAAASAIGSPPTGAWIQFVVSGLEREN
jgi:hypothetical protein